MNTRSRKRAPKSLPPAVSDLVAEGGNILASDDATILTVDRVKVDCDNSMSTEKAKSPRAKPRTVATI